MTLPWLPSHFSESSSLGAASAPSAQPPTHSPLVLQLYLSIFFFFLASNLSTLRACLALAAFPVTRQLMKSCVTTWLVLVSGFYLPSAVTDVAPLLISAAVFLPGFS